MMPRKSGSSWQEKNIPTSPTLLNGLQMTNFLFPMLKRELVGLILSLNKFKKKWEGFIGTVLICALGYFRVEMVKKVCKKLLLDF
jgi:hypothetical protein